MCARASLAVPLQNLEDLARDVTFEAAQNLWLGQSLLGSTGHVLACAFVATHTHERDYPQCPVRVSVAPAVQTVSTLLSGGGVERRDATQGCERCFSLKTLGYHRYAQLERSGQLSPTLARGQEDLARFCDAWMRNIAAQQGLEVR